MQREMISQLLERLDAKQYAASLRHLSHNNKRLKIPGFSLMEKAPIKLVVNTARNNRAFRTALYESISAVILEGRTVDLSKNADEMKKEIPQVQWLGLAAYLLMTGEEEHSADALKIISDCGSEDEPPASTPEVQNTHETKPDKKEEKFREKYLKAKNENAELVADLDRYKAQLQENAVEIEKLKKLQSDLESKCAAYMAEIDTLSGEKARLIQQLEEETEKAQAAQTPKIDIRILAPNCQDVLKKYMDIIRLDFDGNLAMDVTDAIKQYDEIWVFSDVVPFGTYRALRKWKKVAEDKVFIFQTVGDLVAHAENVLQTDGRR